MRKFSPKLGVVYVSFAVFGVMAAGASVTAGSQVCNGYYGYVGNLQPACAYGDASGAGGGVIFGGSGAGSGVNSPFWSDGHGSEFSAQAVAQQDFGIFRGFATAHAVEQNPNIFGRGSAGAYAWGESVDQFTIGGGSGTGNLHLSFGVTGGGRATIFESNGNGSESAEAGLGIVVYLITPHGPNSSSTTGMIRHSGTFALVEDLGFTFGEPFELRVDSFVTAGGGYDRNNPPSFFQVDATAAFQHTSVLSGLTVTDAYGNPVQFTLSAESGTHYPPEAPVPAGVPEPSTFALVGSAAIAVFGRSAARRV